MNLIEIRGEGSSPLASLTREEIGTNVMGSVLGGIAGYNLAKKRKAGGAILGVIVGGWAGYLFGHSVWGKK